MDKVEGGGEASSNSQTVRGSQEEAPELPKGCCLLPLVVVGLLLWGGATAANNLFGDDDQEQAPTRNDMLCDMIVEGTAEEGLSDEVIARRYPAWKNANCDK